MPFAIVHPDTLFGHPDTLFGHPDILFGKEGVKIYSMTFCTT